MKVEDIPPHRVRILMTGAEITAGARNKSYGDPIDNLGLAGKVKQLLRDHCLRTIGPAEQEALDMVVTKICRCYSGADPGEDTYVDGATYFAIAGEVAELERAKEKLRG